MSQDRPHLIKKWPCLFTHDTAGNPLPSFITNGSVAYAPMIPKPRPTRKPK